MTPEDVAATLGVLASRVRRMSPPLASNPERFHEERSDLAELARRVAARTRRASPAEVNISELRRGRLVGGFQIINGRRVQVQKRSSLAVYVGERLIREHEPSVKPPPTLQEAVLAWQRLAPEQKIRATVKVIGGPVYRAHQIERLHYGPKPA